jgi:hypothetical protein
MSLDYHNLIAIRNTLTAINGKIDAQVDELSWDSDTHVEVTILKTVSELLWVVDRTLTERSLTLDKDLT